MNQYSHILFIFAAGSLLVCLAHPLPARQPVVIVIPDYEASKLVDEGRKKSAVVWGNPDSLGEESHLYALHLPNKLTAQAMLTVGEFDYYQGLVNVLSSPPRAAPLSTWKLDRDLFVLPYDWRRDLARTALGMLDRVDAALAVAAKARGKNDVEPKLVLMGHGLGGLVARTMLEQRPDLAARVARLILVGTPNRGHAQALVRLLAGPTRLDEPDGAPVLRLHEPLPTHGDPLAARLVSISHASLYQMLPSGSYTWARVNSRGETRGVAAPDLLSLGTWTAFWPSPQSEKKLFLSTQQPRLAQQPGEPKDMKAWAMAQDLALARLQGLLVATSVWRDKLGPVSRTAALLNQHAPAGTSRLRVVASTGIKTPRGIVTEHAGERPIVRYLYGAGAIGDGVVTLESAFDDISEGEARVLLKNIAHWELCSHPDFLAWIISELTILSALEGSPRRNAGVSP